MILEESRTFIINQNNFVLLIKNEIKGIDLELKKSKKDLLDFRNLAPPDLRNVANPFRILLKQISDLKGKLEFIENSKVDMVDCEMQ